MRKISFVLLVMVMMSAPVAFAQQDVNPTTPAQTASPTAPPVPITMSIPAGNDPWQVSVEGGGLWSEKDKTSLHDGEAILGRMTYDVTPNLALGAESGGLRFEDEIDGTKYGHLDGVPILADLVLKMPIAATGDHLVPYVFESAGVIVWSFDKSDFSDDTGVIARSRAHLASKPGAGLEYYLTPNVALFAEGSYLFSGRFHLRDATTTPPNAKLNVDSIYGGGGLKIAF